MMRTSRWILSRFVPDGAPMESPAVRMRAGMLEGWSSVILNTSLAIFKGLLGLMTGSVSLLADAVELAKRGDQTVIDAFAAARRAVELLASTCLAVLFVPSFYVVLQRFAERIKTRAVPAKKAEPIASNPQPPKTQN